MILHKYPCADCKGSGIDPRGGLCCACHGTGRRRLSQAEEEHRMALALLCRCAGGTAECDGGCFCDLQVAIDGAPGRDGD
jgi:hypothetical protein